MYAFCLNKTRSILFAIIYLVIPYHIFDGAWNQVLGEYIAYTFFPLFFISLYKLIFENEKIGQYLLPINIALIIYSHFVSVYILFFITLVILFISLILGYKFSKSRIIAIIKSLIFTSLSVIWIFIPMITNKLSLLGTPQAKISQVNPLSKIIIDSINNSNNPNSVGIFSIVAFIIGWYFVKNESTVERIIYVLGCILLLFTTEIIPYNLIHGGILFKLISKIQFMYRLLPFAAFFCQLQHP